MKHIVFDLDGTLADSLPGIADGLNRALRSLGYAPHPEEAVREMVGRGARVLCSLALGIPPEEGESPDQQEVTKLHCAFGREYPHTWQNGTRPYPGIPELLKRLVAERAKLAVLSNKPHPVTVPLVRDLFPEIPFEPIYGFSERFLRKPDPSSLLHIAALWGEDPKNVWMVGDSMHDVRTARNAGTRSLLVGWGYGQPDVFRAEGLSPCADVAELAAALGC